MIKSDKPVLFDCVVDRVENCFPMIPSGKAHNEMILSPADEKETKISKAGKTLVWKNHYRLIQKPLQTNS